MKLGQWLGLLAILISLYILWQSRQLLLLVFTAIVLATAINGLVQWFHRLGIQRGRAVGLSLGLLFLVGVAIIALIVPPFIEQFQTLVTLVPEGLDRVRGIVSWLENQVLDPFFPRITDFNGLLQQLIPAGNNFLEQALLFFSTSLSALLELLLVLVLVLMLLVNPQAYRRVLIRLFPNFYRRRVDEILQGCEESLLGWTVGALLEMLFIGVFSWLGLVMLQVPLALAHAVLAGLLNFIPNLGPTLSAVLPIAVALLDEPWKAIAVLILYIAIQQLESFWLTPMVMAQQVSLLPAVTLASQIFFASVFGPLGLLLALPLTVVAKTWIEELIFKDILDNWQPKPSYEATLDSKLD